MIDDRATTVERRDASPTGLTRAVGFWVDTIRCQTSFGLSLLALLIAPSRADAQLSSLTDRDERSCEVLEVEAEELQCEEGRCLLLRRAHLSCDGLDVWADEIDIRFDEEQRFTGAVARGHVAAVEGDSILYCDRATLEGDQITGLLEGATVEVKERAAPLEDLVDVDNRAEIRGNMSRTSARTFEIEDAELTLCDCGDDPASWLLRASTIDADLDGRAILYWSVLWIQPFGWFQLPMSPPIPVISIPFKRRAAGFLPPVIQLFDGIEPLIDLPLFLPLGDSYDLTLTPGIRTDWTTDEGTGLDSFGAPRLGTRLRYAPFKGTQGEIEIQYQRDAGGAAALSRRDEAAGDLCEQPGAPEDCDFRNRVALSIEHRSRLSPQSDLAIDAQWFSDDLLLGDSSIAVENLIQAYLTSRAQIDYRTAPLFGLVSLDYVLRLNNPASDSNTRGEELNTLHRGPHLELRTPPLALTSGLHIDGMASATRYGEWLTSLYTGEEPIAPSQWVLRTAGGLSFADGVGPVALNARAGLDAIWSLPEGGIVGTDQRDLVPIDVRDRRAISLVTEAFASVPLGRRLGSYIHTITPRVGVRSIPWQDGDIPWREDDTRAISIFDPYLERSLFTQGVVAIDQELILDGAPVLRLVLEQPFELGEGERLQTAVRLEASPVRGLNFSTWAQIADQADEPFREIGAQVGYRYRWLTLGGRYARWFQDSERFRRTVYQLSGEPAFVEVEDPQSPGSEQYFSIGGGLDLDLFLLSYGAQYLLRRPGGNNAANEFRPFTSNHSANLTYRSPCNCWGIGAGVILTRRVEPGQDGEEDSLGWDPRFNFTFEIGGYAVGSR